LLLLGQRLAQSTEFCVVAYPYQQAVLLQHVLTLVYSCIRLLVLRVLVLVLMQLMLPLPWLFLVTMFRQSAPEATGNSSALKGYALQRPLSLWSTLSS
jgi:hypothetical protein